MTAFWMYLGVITIVPLKRVKNLRALKSPEHRQPLPYLLCSLWPLWGVGRGHQLLHKKLEGPAVAKVTPAFSHPKKLSHPTPTSPVYRCEDTRLHGCCNVPALSEMLMSTLSPQPHRTKMPLGPPQPPQEG